MIEDNNAVLQIKRYEKCFQCGQLIGYDTQAIDRAGNLIPLDIDKKRHHCNGAQQIAHEEKIVKEILDDLERANKFELRYRLELVIPDSSGTKSRN